MRVLVLHDEPRPDGRADEQDILKQADCVSSALREGGHSVRSVATDGTAPSVEERVRAERPDVVFNLVEEPGGSSRLIHVAPAFLEAIGIPFTGCGAWAIFTTTGKVVAKHVMRLAQIATPPWITRGDLAAGVEPPAPKMILKSAWEHASIGLDDHSIVEQATGAKLASLLDERLDDLGGEGFAESFIAGREFNISLLERDQAGAVLPPAEIDFSAFEAGKPQIVGYRAKWVTGSFEYFNTPRRFEFGAKDAPLVDRLRALALRCWEVFRLRGYARVDVRVDRAGVPWVLEVNANPCLSPDAGFLAAAAVAGMEPREVMEHILRAAFHGTPLRPEPHPALPSRR
jgi:D-alanine-D-alanine ligase